MSFWKKIVWLLPFIILGFNFWYFSTMIEETNQNIIGLNNQAEDIEKEIIVMGSSNPTGITGWAVAGNNTTTDKNVIISNNLTVNGYTTISGINVTGNFTTGVCTTSFNGSLVIEDC